MYVQVACVARVTQTPQTLDELGEGLLLWDHLNTELPSIEAKITPLFDQFAILDKYEVTVAEDVRTTLTDLPNKYRDFQQTLVDADIMLKKHKVRCAACFLSYNVAASIWSLHYLFLHRIVKWFDENPIVNFIGTCGVWDVRVFVLTYVLAWSLKSYLSQN